MLKVRLKARVIERRASPLARRPLKTRPKHRSEYPLLGAHHAVQMYFTCDNNCK